MEIKTKSTKSMRKLILLAVFKLYLIIPFASLYAAGLSTTFSEITIDNLNIGRTYSIKEAIDLPLEILNTSNEPVDLELKLLLPEPQELKIGYESIPSLAWVELERTEFIALRPNGIATTDVVISIPDDEEYLGKQYQVFIWAYTVGERIDVGLKSNLLLKISQTYSIADNPDPPMPPVSVIVEGIVDNKLR